MIHGRFGNTTGSPYVEARVSFPRLKNVLKTPAPGEADVSFLADTGADRTTIMPTDFSRFLLDESQFQNQTEVYGVSGKGIAFVEEAIITFSELGVGLRVYVRGIMIMKSTQYIQQAPSLLGRDIMSNWSVIFDAPANRFAARIVRADHTLKFSKTVLPLGPIPGVQAPMFRS